MNKVIVYCRESRDDGGENYERIETQRDILIRFCRRRELGEIVEVIMDDNLSGSNFQRLEPVREMILRGEANVFVCKDASRIGRNLLDSLKFIEFLEAHGVELVFESEAYNEDIFPLIAWFNERRVKEDSAKIRRVLRHKMETGSLVVKAPYGYVKEGGTIVPDGETAAVVREIFAWYARGKGMYEIAGMLNRKGVPTPSRAKGGNLPITNEWNKQHVGRILRHVAYGGDMPYGMREKINYKSKKYRANSPDDWIIVKNHHEALVDRETFQAAGERLRRTAGNSRDFSAPKSLFSGLLTCGRCGGKLYAKKQKGKTGALICAKNNREGGVKKDSGTGCAPHRVTEEELADLVRAFLHKLLSEPKYREAVREGARLGDGRQRRAALRAGLRANEKQAETLRQKASRIYEDKLSGLVPAFLFSQKLDELTQKMNGLETENKRIREELENTKTESESGGPEEKLRRAAEGYPLTRSFLSMLFEKITVYGPGELRERDPGMEASEFAEVRENGGVVFRVRPL